jgi:cytidylate kinase
MIIVIEGSNCVGKTTVAKYLANRLGYHYVHFPTAKGDVFPGINTEYGELFRQTGDQSYAKLDIETNIRAIEKIGNVVVDRLWISHLIYSGNDILLDCPYHTVILYASGELLTKRFVTRSKVCNYTEHNKEFIYKQIIQHNDAFINLGATKNIPMICVDSLSVEEIADMI